MDEEKKEDKRKTVVDNITDIADEFCNNYCKYPDIYDPEDHNGVELWDSGICDNCPLGRLV